MRYGELKLRLFYESTIAEAQHNIRTAKASKPSIGIFSKLAISKESKKNHTRKLFLVLVLRAITLMGLSCLPTNGQLLLGILIVRMGNLV